jgi:hypothetical protein
MAFLSEANRERSSPDLILQHGAAERTQEDIELAARLKSGVTSCFFSSALRLLC